VRFQVITEVNMTITAFWAVARSVIALMMEAASTFETSVNFYRDI
jgi:hypothetical protein